MRPYLLPFENRLLVMNRPVQSFHMLTASQAREEGLCYYYMFTTFDMLAGRAC